MFPPGLSEGLQSESTLLCSFIWEKEVWKRSTTSPLDHKNQLAVINYGWNHRCYIQLVSQQLRESRQWSPLCRSLPCCRHVTTTLRYDHIVATAQSVHSTSRHKQPPSHVFFVAGNLDLALGLSCLGHPSVLLAGQLCCIKKTRPVISTLVSSAAQPSYI